MTHASVARLKMPPKAKKTQKCWSLHPELHKDVAELLRAYNIHFKFHTTDSEEGAIKEYDTSVMATFRCRSSTCLEKKGKEWSSMQVAITIRMYTGRRYNARVYYQRCRQCNSLAAPTLDESYADRVSYRLQKWSGLSMTPPQFSGTSKGPHRKNLCEGCRNGRCSKLTNA